MGDFWRDKRVLVTGGDGFLGRHLVVKLKDRGCANIFIPSHNDFDLVNKEDIERMYFSAKPHIVIHLAAVVGGIGANRKHPAKFFYENLIMGINLLHEGYKSGVRKFVAIGTVCAYPKFTPVPFREENLWDGYPEETNAPYGLAKKMLLVQSQSYRDEYGFNSIFLLPVNLYGPGDNFNPDSSHVIPALIKKFHDAILQNRKEVVIWGDGTATREFLYVEDAARAILLASEKHNTSEPVNIGSGMEISIKDLSEKIASMIGFDDRIIYDKSKPNGQPKRRLDVSKAKKYFGFESQTNFDVGLKKTIDYYIKEVSCK